MIIEKKQIDHSQLAHKREPDPDGVLNRGKMLAWDDPDYTPHPQRFLYASLDGPDTGRPTAPTSEKA